jgi:hypothetical protein
MNGRKAWLALALLLVGGAVGAAPDGADTEWRYRIQPGDTLLTLTEEWLAPGKTWRDLQRLNLVRDPLRLKPGSTLRMPLAWLKREASVAQVVFSRGPVERQRGGAADALAAGTTLQSGDRIRTGAQASVSLRFADGSRLLVPPDSDVTLEQLMVLGRAAIPAVTVRVNQGGSDHRVVPNPTRPPLYDVRTPHVNLGVRGTEFRVQADGVRSRMQVHAGAVRADGLAADVTPGQGLLAEGGARSVTPLLPAPDLSRLPATVERLPLQLGWPVSPAGAVAWRAQLYASGDAERLLLDARVDAPAATWPEAAELPDGEYMLRVRGIDARGQEGAAAEAALSLQARPEPPYVQSPATDAVRYDGHMPLAWARNTQAPRVRLQIARDAGFADLVLQPAPIDAAEFDARLPDGTYHWRIAAVEPGGRAGPFGEAQTFALQAPPPAPPPATREVAGDQLTLRWRAVTGAARYDLEWSKTEAFDGADVQRLSSEAPALALDKPSPGTYYLRARAVNAAGAPGPWGQTQQIEQPRSRWFWLLPLLLIALL